LIGSQKQTSWKDEKGVKGYKMDGREVGCEEVNRIQVNPIKFGSLAIAVSNIRVLI
jgi:hypothetical protein